MPRGDKTTVVGVRFTTSDLDRVKELASLLDVETSEAVRLAIKLAHAVETQLLLKERVVVGRTTEVDVDAVVVRVVDSRLLVFK